MEMTAASRDIRTRFRNAISTISTITRITSPLGLYLFFSFSSLSCLIIDSYHRPVNPTRHKNAVRLRAAVILFCLDQLIILITCCPLFSMKPRFDFYSPYSLVCYYYTFFNISFFFFWTSTLSGRRNFPPTWCNNAHPAWIQPLFVVSKKKTFFKFSIETFFFPLC